MRAVPLQMELGPILARWKALNVRYGNDLLDCDPEWLLELYRGEESKVLVFLLEKEGELEGVVAFERSNKPHFFKLGEFRAAKLPFKSLRLLGYSLSIPADTNAYDALFREIAGMRGTFDALYMGHVEIGSLLWNYLRFSPVIQSGFRHYGAVGAQPHPLVRFNGTFENYMEKFSSKSRNTLRRRVKTLWREFRVDLVRSTRPEDVDGLFDDILKIAGNTWQSQLHGQAWGIMESDPSIWKRRLKFAAERGWLRAYVLKCNGSGCAFILGIQHAGRFYHVFLGFDQGWSQYSVGTVLQLLVLEDLFQEDPPQLYDFGTYFEYKARFANETYSEERIALFPRRAYPLLVETLDRTWNLGTHQAALLFDQLHVKPGLRHLMRILMRRGHAQSPGTERPQCSPEPLPGADPK